MGSSVASPGILAGVARSDSLERDQVSVAQRIASLLLIVPGIALVSEAMSTPEFADHLAAGPGTMWMRPASSQSSLLVANGGDRDSISRVVGHPPRRPFDLRPTTVA